MAKTNLKTKAPINHQKIAQSASPISAFCEELVLAAGLDSLSEDFKKVYIERLTEEAIKRIGAVALTHLDADSSEEFMKRVQDDKVQPDDVFNFLKGKIKDFDQKMIEALDEFAHTFITTARAAAEA